MTSPLEIANRQQRDASDPKISTFVAASAGSGKTKLLTDRILRLLLTGTPARKILCLTYTKAAAAEMAIRLNNRLGAWVIMPEAKLATQLSQLGIEPSAKSILVARQLFAEILDLPGGMRISTIHAFCQSLLKRFPLEAQLSPHFEVEDETGNAARLREAREISLSDPDKINAIVSLAAQTNEWEFAKTVARFAQDGDIQSLLNEFSPAAIQAMQSAALGKTDFSDAELDALSITLENEIDLLRCLQSVADRGTPSGKIWAANCAGWLGKTPQERLKAWHEWQDFHFTKAGERRDLKKNFGKALAGESGILASVLEIERTRIERITDLRRTSKIADFNASMIELIGPIMRHHRRGKTAQSLLSYADLISITLDLLSMPEQIAWILYKLDEGIDHLLLDEVQDTSPAQWKITDAIAREFFTGLGAREVPRSIFAVGDHKQSIFSFQGADLESFDAARERFHHLADAAGKIWHDGDLSVSFRSTAPVLALVDAVFAQGEACHGVCPPNTLRHFVSREGQAGAVTLWPLTKAIEAAPAPDWDVPETYVNAKSEKAILAGQIADHIKAAIADKTPMPSRGRAVSAGDFLILVRRRDELVTELTRACKARNIPVSGLDRLVLTESQAVSDLLALCDSLLLPSDDLAFAQFLVSPLGGLSDESLMDLGLSRRGTLSAALFARRGERDDWSQANDFFQTLRRKIDFISPYALLAFALGVLGGRAKLMQRLGPEAAEPVDELLAEAQAHAKSRPASLQQFVFDLRQSGATVKREPEGLGDVVRIMTVHGAKGLQAPIVILPDTTTIPKTPETLFWLRVPQQNRRIPVLCPHKDLRSHAVNQAIAEAKQAQTAEYNRLLYVALTRAEDELIICGAEGKTKAPAGCWYNLVAQGFATLSAAHRTPQTAAPDRISTVIQVPDVSLPGWAGAAPSWQAVPPSAETKRPEPLAPSRSGEAPEAAETALSPLAPTSSKASALSKGKAVHTLLQHLPALPVDRRAAAAALYLRQPGLGLSAAVQAGIARSVIALLGDGVAQALFGPGARAEVPLAGIVGDIEIGGLVDRLVVTEDAVMIADFKTDRNPPEDATGIPPAYLRQLAAYQAILSQIYPEKPVSCQLIWTETVQCMTIDPMLLAWHAPGPAQPFAT